MATLSFTGEGAMFFLDFCTPEDHLAPAILILLIFHKNVLRGCLVLFMICFVFLTKIFVFLILKDSVGGLNK